MSVRADHYEEGTLVRARPPHPYDTAWRTIGTVVWSADARLVWGGDGYADAGSVSFVVDPSWVVRGWPPRFHAGPCADGREPDEGSDDDAADLAAHRYERALGERLARRGCA